MDPALWELLRAEAGADGDRVLEAIIRLARPGIEIPDIRIVSRFGTLATCRIRARDIVPVRARPDVVSLKAAHGLSPGFEPATGAAAADALPPAGFRPADVRRSPGLALTGKGVVVASVDWGVDVDSAAFRWPSGPAAAGGDRPAGGTRFLSFWDQRDLAAGPRPYPYGYGTVHDREQIDGALLDPRPYEQLGYHPAIADRGGHGTHGTHVLDIAAGNGQAGGPAGIAPGADLIFVHLADRTTGGLANLGDSVRLLEAVDFISRTAGSQPCVINISAGRTCGPKDGTTLAERALDELLAATPGRFVVNSAGNYFGWRTHSCGRVAPGESRSLTFAIDPADITLNELEIWYDGADEFAVRVDPPGYAGGRVVRLGERSDLVIEGSTAGRVYHRKHDPNNGDNHIVVYIDPIGRPGNWTVTLEARQVSSGRFHAWIERDDTCRGCQARFTPTDSNASTTIGTITTSRLPLIVGAYDGHDPARPVAPFSSSGPSRDLRPKPDLVAPGVDVLAARSASIIDSHNPGLLVRKSGTSMATPHVTGAVALCLEAAGNTLSARQIRSLVLGSCDPARAPDAPYRLGRGYLNIPRLITDLQRTLTGPSAKEPTMNTDDNIVPLAAAPATAYREYLYRPHSQLARWIDERFDVVARPGQRTDQAPQLGDVLLEVPLGQVKPGRCLILRAHDPELIVSPRRLPASQLLLRPRKRAEMSEPLPVEPTVETEGFTPLVDVGAGAPAAAGAAPPPPRIDGMDLNAGDDSGAASGNTPAWIGSPEQLVFRDRVLKAHLALSRQRRAPQRDLSGDELERVPGSDVMTARATALAAGRLLAAANADLRTAQHAGDADALCTLRLTVTSGYRSSQKQRTLWLSYFSRKDGYYDRTQAARGELANGPHSEQALAYLLRPKKRGGFGLAGRIAAPGYSSHQGGIAVDFLQQRTPGYPVANDSGDSARARWRTTWFHKWLIANAAAYGFRSLSTEEWHWTYRPASCPPATPAPGGAVMDAEDDDLRAEEDTTKIFTLPTIPNLTGNIASPTTITWAGRSVEVHYFPGNSGQTVLVLGGVHQDERKAIALSSEVLKQLQSSKGRPFYNIVFIQNLFGGRNVTSQEIDKTTTNRNSPRQSESLADSIKRGKGTPIDAEGCRILPENVILFAIVEKIQPKASLSIHGHSIVRDPKDIEKKGAASVTVDPKPGGEQEADFIATEMALAASKAGVPVPGNQVKDETAKTRYPTETATHRQGVTFGQWGSHHGGMNQYLIETEGKPWPDQPSLSQQAEISSWAQVIQSKFLANPLAVVASALARNLTKLQMAAGQVLLGN